MRAKLKQADEEYYISASYLLEIVSRAGQLFRVAEPEEKRVILKMILQNCVLNEKKLFWELNKPFDTVLSHIDRQIWLPLVRDIRTLLKDDGYWQRARQAGSHGRAGSSMQRQAAGLAVVSRVIRHGEYTIDTHQGKYGQ